MVIITLQQIIDERISLKDAASLFDRLTLTAARYATSAGTLTKDTLEQEIPKEWRRDDYLSTFDRTVYDEGLQEYLNAVKHLKNYKHKIDQRPLDQYFIKNSPLYQSVS